MNPQPGREHRSLQTIRRCCRPNRTNLHGPVPPTPPSRIFDFDFCPGLSRDWISDEFDRTGGAPARDGEGEGRGVCERREGEEKVVRFRGGRREGEVGWEREAIDYVGGRRNLFRRREGEQTNRLDINLSGVASGSPARKLTTSTPGLEALRSLFPIQVGFPPQTLPFPPTTTATRAQRRTPHARASQILFLALWSARARELL